MKQLKVHKWLWMFGVVSLMAATPSLARAADKADCPERTLSVSGQAEVLASPDRAQVSFGAEAQAKDASDAVAKVNAIMNQALENVKKLGIDDDAIRTTQITLRPVYDQIEKDETGPAMVVAYRANNSVQVTVDDLSMVGNVLDAANDAGANRQNGVNFELKDDAAMRAVALKQAAKEARDKAKALADVLGVRLVAVKSVREGHVNIVYPRPYRGGMVAMAKSESTPVQAGQITVQANVSLVYVIAER